MICNTQFVFPTERPAEQLLVCYSGQEKCEPSSRFGPAVRDHYIIHYVLRGRGTLECNNRKYTLSAASGFLIPPYQTATYTADPQNPWEYVWIAFRGGQADSILAQCGLSAEMPVFQYRLDEPLEVHIPVDYCASSVSDWREYAALGELYSFLGLLIRNYESQKGMVKPAGQALRAALDYIEANFFNDLSVEELAAQVGLSRSQLFRIFKGALGVSVQAYILQFRLRKARALVCNTELNMTEIALSCGFQDTAYFTRCFKRQYGLAPLVYRTSDEARPMEQYLLD